MVHELFDKLAGLTPEKRALLVQRLGALSNDDTSKQLCRRSHESQQHPVSFAQQRLWFLDQLIPGLPRYNLPAAIRLNTSLNADVLRKSLDEIVRRHEILRTSIAQVDGEIVQIVAPPRPQPLTIVDLRPLPVVDREAEAIRLATIEARRRFDLERGPLIRTALLEISDRESVFLLTMHHIISDGWSMGVFWKELETLFSAFTAERPSPLPELPVQYADFAIWQRHWLRGEVLEQQLAYWKDQLEGVSMLDLPVARDGRGNLGYEGLQIDVVIPKRLVRQLKILSRQQGVTTFMVLLGAFQIMLHRYSGQTDVVVGTPAAGRNRTELEGLIGFFVNTIVMRGNLSGDPTVRQFLARVRDMALSAFAHQDLPFEKLVQEISPSRQLNRNPIFQVMFQVFSELKSDQDNSTHTENVHVDRGTALVDLALHFWERRDEILGQIEYSTELFDRSTINRMSSHFQQVLEGMVADADQPVSRLSLLSEEERKQVLGNWSAGAPLAFAEARLETRFERQVQETPDSVALIDGKQHIRFADLNRQANQLAHDLLALGVQAEVPVAVCLERSPAMVATLLAVWKAGGAYVPLDPSYPEERLAFMLADSGAQVLISQPTLRQRLPEVSLPTIWLDDERHQLAAEPVDDLEPGGTIDSLAYVMYTSGSTGVPKGVLATHRAAVNRLEWMWQAYPFSPGEVACQKTALSFVDSVWEIFGPLLAGVPSVIIPDPILKDPQSLLHTLAREQVTRLVLVPSLLEALLDSVPDLAASLPKLTHWITSGEALSAELARRFTQQLPRARLLNLYGSSEVAGDVTFHEISSAEQSPRIPIGRPIANSRVYVLDRWQQPVPVGVVGELYVGGQGLARGYRQRPDLTAQTFVPDPFTGQPSGRLYRTADLVRYRSDGQLEFLGRLDHQVKLRGYRIEPGEIEAALRQHPMVRQAVVTVDQQVAGEGQLTAYLVASCQEEISPADLRQFLRRKLPEYMIPVAFLQLPELPLTPNGKLDRRRLPSPDSQGLGANAYEAPRNAAETTLCRLWAEVLEYERVGITDNFFDLGGHSLLAMRLVSRIRQEFQIDLPLRVIFEKPNIEQIGQLVIEAVAADENPTADDIAIPRVQRDKFRLKANEETQER